MTRLFALAVVALSLAASAGCSVCYTPFDYAYPTYGGKWQRTDRFHGRVGSAFEPAGPFPVEEAPPTEEVEGKLEPTPAPKMEMDEAIPDPPEKPESKPEGESTTIVE
jgi:hypothetical protein